MPQPALESSPLSTNKQPGQPAWSKSDFQKQRLLSLVTVRKLKDSLCNYRPQMARAWLITNSFPNFCTHFQLRANQRKPDKHPYPSHMCHTSRGSSTIPHTNLQLGRAWSFFLPPSGCLLLNLCLTLRLCQNPGDRGWLLCYSKLFQFSYCVVLHLFPQSPYFCLVSSMLW